MAKSGTASGQADLWSDILPSRDILWPSLELLQVFGQMYALPPTTNAPLHPAPPPVETSCFHVWYNLGRLTFAQMYPLPPTPNAPAPNVSLPL